MMLFREVRKALIGCESHGSRIIKASFKTKEEGIKMNVIQCYAPTSESKITIKINFMTGYSRS
ncbi:unnamed protein product [Schistosoma margrebowiei]|uniref:Uncharacterized protein n=1 Tax=Schistosoma margrebowiei TaxID=48269 RepID=A0A3P7WAU1_9TREM|nr:unnamed protein product [Schistosoma margrebowiei]